MIENPAATSKGRIDNPGDVGRNEPDNRTSLWLLLILSLIAVLPVWIPSYPPMADLPHHAAQVALLHELGGANFAYSSLFHLNWFTPYLFGYLLIYALMPLIGIVAACKMVISFYVVGLTLATAILLRSLGADVFWAIFCILGVYGFAYQWGFLNFLMAAPLGILFLWFVLRSARRPMNIGTGILLAVLAVALFFCHALICGFFGLCAVLCLLMETQSWKAAAVRILPLAAVLPVAALWTRATLAHPSTKRPNVWDLGLHYSGDIYYSEIRHEQHLHSLGWGRITGLFPRVFGITPSWHAMLFGLLLLLLPFLAGMRLRKKPGLWIPFLLCVLVLMFVPTTILGTDFVFQRFSVFLFPLFVLLLRQPEASPRWAGAFRWVAVIVIGGWIATNALRAVAFSRETRGFQHALALMQPGQRVLSLDFDHEDGLSITPTFLAFPQWYAAQKQGVTEPSVAMMFPELVIYRSGMTPKAVLWDFEWNPDKFHWKAFSGSQYRYFVVRATKDMGETLFSDATCPVSQRLHEGEWWLYERSEDCAVPEEAATASSQ